MQQIVKYHKTKQHPSICKITQIIVYDYILIHQDVHVIQASSYLLIDFIFLVFKTSGMKES